MTTPQDRLTIEGLRQTVAAQQAEIEAEHNALGRLGIATLEIARLRDALTTLLSQGLDHDDFVLVHRSDWADARAALGSER